MAARFAEIIETPGFERVAKKLFNEEEFLEISYTLAVRPRTGRTIPRTGGFRKIRFGLEGRGKSGGSRVIYYYVDRCERVYLVDAYAKNVRENLTREEENTLKALAKELDEEC